MPDLAQQPELLAMTGVPVSLRTYFEAILDEQRRGLVVAEQEREKAAQALRIHLETIIREGDRHLRETLAASVDEARRGLNVAEQEREKAAKALRGELARAISDGDTNLREHIGQQVQQIQAALVSAEKLEIQRFAEVARAHESYVRENDRRIKDVLEAANDRLESVRREVLLIQKAAVDAVQKAEIATEKRFESVNEFRAQLADQSGSFLPREVAESQFAELRKQIADNAKRIDRGEGLKDGGDQRRAQTQPWMIWAAGAFVSLLIALVVIGVGAFT